MSDADDAFIATERLIALAKKGRALSLDLDTTQTHAINTLPPAISTLTALTTLDLSRTQITDLSPLTKLNALTTLDLRGTLVTDLSPLTKLTNLTALFLGDTQVTDFSPLTKLAALNALILNGTQITDLSPLSKLTALIGLDLRGTRITDLSPLTQLTALTALLLRGSHITDLSPLTELTALSWLELIDTQITDPRPLVKLTKLATEPKSGGLIFTGTPFAALPEFTGIAEIEDNAERAHRLFAALEGWVPPWERPQEQSSTGFRYGVSPDGVVAYAQLPALTDPTLQQRQLHALLVEDVADLQAILHSESHPARAPFAAKLSRYGRALGVDVAQVDPVLLWKAGNDIRLLLRADAELKRLMVNEPTLDPVAHAMLQGFVAAHNNFAALHPDLSPLEHAQIDPAEAHRADNDRALLQAAIDAFALQTRLIVEEVTLDLRDLHAEGMGQSNAALRALRIEVDSLENLVKTLLAQATLEARNDTLVSRVVGDMRSAVVGAGVATATTIGPAAATSFLQMIYVLQPQLADLLNTLQGQGGTLSHSVDYVVNRLRQAMKK